jgi:hypothetical protein
MHLMLEQKKQLISDKDAGTSTDDLVEKFGILEQNAEHETVKMVDKLEMKIDSIRLQRSIQPKISDFFRS